MRQMLRIGSYASFAVLRDLRSRGRIEAPAVPSVWEERATQRGAARERSPKRRAQERVTYDVVHPLCLALRAEAPSGLSCRRIARVTDHRREQVLMVTRNNVSGRSRRAAILNLAGGAALLAACGEAGAPATGGAQGTPAQGGKQAEIHVSFRQGSDAEWQQKLIPQFQAQNPGVKVVLDVLPAEPEYWAKVQALYATGQVGDMI